MIVSVSLEIELIIETEHSTKSADDNMWKSERTSQCGQIRLSPHSDCYIDISGCTFRAMIGRFSVIIKMKVATQSTTIHSVSLKRLGRVLIVMDTTVFCRICFAQLFS